MSALRLGGIRFYPKEVRDLLAAWLALGVAFAVFIFQYTGRTLLPGLLDALTEPLFARVFVISLLTVGVGFLLHELAHKVVAVRFGQVAAFRADYKMLVFAVALAFAGFIFAAPGAVYHRGHISDRENGLVSIAGPLTNVGLVALFAPLLVGGGFLHEVGQLGVTINAFLAGFNMIPFGPLDGRKVLAWSKLVFVLAFAACAGLAVAALLLVGLPY